MSHKTPPLQNNDLINSLREDFHVFPRVFLSCLCFSVIVRMAEGFLMEACVDSVESAVNAERGGWSSGHDSAPFFKVPLGNPLRLAVNLWCLGVETAGQLTT